MNRQLQRRVACGLAPSQRATRSAVPVVSAFVCLPPPIASTATCCEARMCVRVGDVSRCSSVARAVGQTGRCRLQSRRQREAEAVCAWRANRMRESAGRCVQMRHLCSSDFLSSSSALRALSAHRPHRSRSVGSLRASAPPPCCCLTSLRVVAALSTPMTRRCHGVTLSARHTSTAAERQSRQQTIELGITRGARINESDCHVEDPQRKARGGRREEHHEATAACFDQASHAS